jgi:hypothetical protein
MHKKNTGNPKRYETKFKIPPQLHEKILSITWRSKKCSIQNTVNALLSTALKYNFDSNLNYIPCVQQSEPVTFYLPSQKSRDYSRTKTVHVYINANPFLKIKELATKNGMPVTVTIRMCMVIALQYCFDENLRFVKPVPVPMSDKTNDFGFFIT